MTLRKKILILLGITLLILVLILYIISRAVLLKSYALLEEQNTSNQIKLVLKTLSEIISVQDSKTSDWANWDDTYDFIEKKKQEYIKKNLTDKAFSELKINLMLFIDHHGRVVHGKAFNLGNQREMTVPQGIQKYLSRDSLILRNSDPASGYAGIVLLPEGPMIITSRPIMTSEGKEPVRGTLIFGRYLDDVEMQKMTEEGHYALSLHRIDEGQLPDDVTSVLPLLSKQDHVHVKPTGSDTVGAYAMLEDVEGNPALVLKLSFARDIYKKGQETVRYFIFLMVGAGLIFGIVVISILEKQVLSRLSRLSKQVREIGVSGDLSRQISLKGKDELSHLSDEMNRMLEELKKSGENYRNLFENANDLIQSVDAEGRFINVNKKWRTTLGYTLEEARQMHFANIIRKDHVLHCLEMAKRISEGESVDSAETVFVSKDGREIYVEGSINAQHINGTFVCTRGIFRDISRRKQMERALQESEEKFRMMTNTAKDAIIMMDHNGIVIYWNRAAEEVFGYSMDEILGKELHSILAPMHYHDAYKKGMETFRTAGKGNAVGKTIELTGLRKDGSQFPLELSMSAVKLNEQWNAVGIVRDITVRKTLEARLKDMSYKDELTGLYNRRGFMEFAKQQIKVAGRTKEGMLLFSADLDDMKHINDRYGHQQGDRALIETANVLQRTFRSSDIIARIGGDEFFILALATKPEHSGLLHAQLNRYVTERNQRGNLPFALSLSVGFAYYDSEHPESLDQLIARSDTMMYEEKRKRKAGSPR